MLIVNNDEKSIHATRGDEVVFSFSTQIDGADYVFKIGDVVRFSVTEKNDCSKVVLTKDFNIEEETAAIDIIITGEEMKIGEVISKPKDYWYEIELNPLTKPQTVIGYDTEGPKLLRLYPEGSVK